MRLVSLLLARHVVSAGVETPISNATVLIIGVLGQVVLGPISMTVWDGSGLRSQDFRIQEWTGQVFGSC